ncbi:MAG TPA: patatin-like phospholipase family protein [Candidatus Sulfomarinibacteraceae bacterium]|nr:patatin-like phospholipase family protein [Candidatus Sulfomarinibacteraceae bacterium]
MRRDPRHGDTPPPAPGPPAAARVPPMIDSARASSRVGLALAGGGPEGSIYEIGAIRALDEALDGIDLNDLHVYVGVSAGAFIAACLANNLTTGQMCRAIVKHEPGEHPFVPETFLSPAVGEFVRGGMKVPRLLLDGIWDVLRRPRARRLTEPLARLARALPVGVFENEPLRAYLAKIFSMPGRSDDFRRLRRHLVVVATDLDSGRPVRFGEPGLDHVPISKAVQASTALPGLYPPVTIAGRDYVDGVLLKTVHASVALDAGADLVLCVNPIVPVDTIRSVELGIMRRGRLAERGLPAVLAQTFRTIIHSRMGAGLAAYETRYSDRDVLVFEPRRDDYSMFFSNVFSFANRKAVCEHAYRSTRLKLWRNRRRLEPMLARHGITLRTDLLEDQDRDLWQSVGLHERRPPSTSHVKARLDKALAQVEELLAGH